jgi:ankyrin repeat protein
MLATKLGYHDIVKVLIQFGSDTDWRDISGRSPLFYAVQNEDIELIPILIANGSSAFALDNYGNSLCPIMDEEAYS